MSKLKVAVLFGGKSSEHDVSIITGLQVLEKIDRKVFEPYALYLTQDNSLLYYPGLKDRKDFRKIKPLQVYIARDKQGVFFKPNSILGSKVYTEVAYLAFHGGSGESGQLQGMLEVLDLPYTSPSVESSVITMNKALTKDVLRPQGVDTLDAVSVLSNDIQESVERVSREVLNRFKLPLIVKPVHLGSSVGINIAKTSVELKKYLLEASFTDSEVLVEEYIKGFKEYNCAVRLINDNLEASEVEEPIARDEILSFVDKYQRGGNKKGSSGGMASLTRNLPADIPDGLRSKIQEAAKKAFLACRCKGMVRVDFMYYKRKLYVVEINPIPGSMAFYLWEASGVSFTQQITNMIEQAITDEKLRKSKFLKYSSDIVEKFTS